MFACTHPPFLPSHLLPTGSAFTVTELHALESNESCTYIFPSLSQKEIEYLKHFKSKLDFSCLLATKCAFKNE